MKKIDIIDFQAIKHPICYDGDKNNIPNEATGTNLASLQTGFPMITEKKLSENGLPPVRKDFNGLFYISTDLRFNLQNGCFISFNQNVSDAIGGYPKDAILYFINSNNKFKILRSLIDDNNYNFVVNESLIDNIHWQEVEIDGDISNYSNINIYNKNSLCKIEGIIVKSLIDNNLNNNPINSNIWSYDKAEIISYQTKPSLSSEILTIYANTLFSVPNGIESNGIYINKLIKNDTDITLSITGTNKQFIFLSNDTLYSNTNEMKFIDSSEVASITDTNIYKTNDTNKTYIGTTETPLIQIGYCENNVFYYNGNTEVKKSSGGDKGLDWDNAISVSSPFTAPADGFIYYHPTQSYSGTDIRIYINSILIGAGSHNNSASYTLNISSPIFKNDVCSFNYGTIYFIPYKQ